MILAVASLARHRLAGRAGATMLLVAAVAAATGLAGTIRTLGLAATDAAVAASLADLDPADRALRLSGYAPSNAGPAELDRVARAASAQTTAFADEATPGLIFRRVRDPGAPYDLQLVAVDGAGGSITIIEGRAPVPCDGAACEAVLLSLSAAPADLPLVVHIDDLEVRIVGRATLASPIPLGHLDERGPQLPPADLTAQAVDPPPALLLTDGVAALASAPGAAAVGRTYLWTAPLRTAAIHPWTAAGFESALEAARRGLVLDGPDLFLTAPSETIRAELARGAVNDGRLLMVGSLGVAILVAFAGFAALLGRHDLRAELGRLSSAGSGRAAGVLLVGLEVLIPAAIGTIAGWIGAALAGGALAAAAGADPGGVVAHALADGGSLALAGVVLGASVVAILAGLFGVARRETVAGLVPGGIAVAALVGWRLLAGGGLDADALSGATDAPVLAALPALVGILVASVAVTVVPIILRRLAGSPRRQSLHVRLALLSLARDPVRPAATITLLAFGIGGLVFALADAATLRRGISDHAAYAIGMDLRVTEAAPGLSLSAAVVPVDRYSSLGNGVTAVPVAHVAANAGPAGGLTVVGISPSALAELRGWRDDLGAEAASLGGAIAVDGDFTVPGIVLAPDATTIAVTVTHAGDPVALAAVVAATNGDAAQIFLGTLRPGHQTMAAPLPDGARDGRIIAIVISEGRLVAGPTHPAGLARATLAFEGLETLTGPDPVAVEVSGTQSAILRAPYATDSLVLPAIVGPALAAAVRASGVGTLALALGDRPLTRIRVAGVLPRFPGAPEAGESFAVVALDPLLMAMDGAAPGAGRPDEAWLRVDAPARLADVRAALEAPPFRAVAVRSREGLETAAAADPFASSILAAFAAAGAAGLLLAALGLALGALTDLRDEAGEFRDLEAQGMGPRALRRQVGARTLLLAAGGTLSGIVMGLGLAALVTAALAVGADGSRPAPPLILEVPLAGLAAAAAAPMIAAAVLAGVAAGRAFQAAARARDRA